MIGQWRHKPFAHLIHLWGIRVGATPVFTQEQIAQLESLSAAAELATALRAPAETGTAEIIEAVANNANAMVFQGDIDGATDDLTGRRWFPRRPGWRSRYAICTMCPAPDLLAQNDADGYLCAFDRGNSQTHVLSSMAICLHCAARNIPCVALDHTAGAGDEANQTRAILCTLPLLGIPVVRTNGSTDAIADAFHQLFRIIAALTLDGDRRYARIKAQLQAAD